MKKLVLIGLPLSDGKISSGDSSGLLAKAIRTADRSLSTNDLSIIPIVDGGPGTLDFIVSHTLGSFLEVQTTNARNEQIIAPLGLAGEDNHLAVIEMQCIAGVEGAGAKGTTFGVGELIQDALDEGAFSVLLGHSEPLAGDLGLGIAQALGVKFLGGDKQVLDLRVDPISAIEHVDASARDFQLLSSRMFLARSGDAQSPGSETAKEIKRIAKIVKRDCGLEPSIPVADFSASAIEFGLSTFLNAEMKDGFEFVSEIAEMQKIIDSAERVIVFAKSAAQFSGQSKLSQMLVAHPAVTLLSQSASEAVPLGFQSCISLKDAVVFQAPLREGASAQEIRRDIAIRLEKLAPALLGIAAHAAS